MAEWAREYFEHGYAQRWALDPPSESTRQEVDYLWQLLRLDTGDPLLDVGCGHGRHAVAFQQRGARVTGLDFTAALLNRARSIALDSSAAASWVRGDMRQLPFRSQTFRAAVLFDAFGFFEPEGENLAVLHEVSRVLIPGGRLALRLVNAEPILKRFRETDREERDGTVVEISRAVTLNPARLTERLVISGPRGGGRYERHQRLYGVDAITEFLKNAGFILDAVLSSATGGRFEAATSPAMVVISERADDLNRPIGLLPHQQ